VFESDLYIIRVLPYVKIIKKQKNKKHCDRRPSTIILLYIFKTFFFFMENQKCNLMAIGMHNPHIVILT
jgi:hypothetical protein